MFTIVGQRSGSTTLLDSFAIANDAPHEREDMVTAVLPCKPGWLKSLSQTLAVDNTGTGQPEHVQWEPFGPELMPFMEPVLHPDGSYKLVRCTFPVRLGPNEERMVPIRLGTGAGGGGHVYRPDVLIALGQLTFNLTIEGQTLSLMSFSSSIVMDKPRALIQRWRGRFPATAGSVQQFWAQLDIQIHSDMRHARFWLWFGNSYVKTNPGNVGELSEHPETAFELTQPVTLTIGHNNFVGVLPLLTDSFMRRELSPNGQHVITLLDPAQLDPLERRFPDGTGFPFVGTLLFHASSPPLTALQQSTHAAESVGPVSAKAMGWRDTGLANPLWEGVIPPYAPQFASEAAAKSEADALGARMLGARVDGHPFAYHEGGHTGSNPRPGGTGDQPVFGRIQMWPEYATASVRRLPALYRSALFDFKRPLTFREHDTLAIPSPESHPKTFYWNCRPFINSPTIRTDDMFGKRVGLEGAIQPARPFEPIIGHDRQHFLRTDRLHLTQVTGDWLLLQFLEVEIQNYRLSWALNSGNATIEGIEASRAVDRGFQNACHVHAITGHTLLKSHVDARINMTYGEFASWNANWPNADIRTIRPEECGWFHDPRWPGLSGQTFQDQANMWQSAMAVGGLVAAYKLTGNPNALALAKELSRTVCKFGLHDRSGVARQVILCQSNFFHQRPLYAPGDVFIERDLGNVEVARGTFVGAEHGGVIARIHLKDCTAAFPGRLGAILECVNNSEKSTPIFNRIPGLQIYKSYWFDTTSGGKALTQQQLDQWDPVGFGVPPKDPGDDVKFVFVEHGDSTDYLWWGAAAFAYGQVWGREAGDAVWEYNARAVVAFIKAQSQASGRWDNLPVTCRTQHLALPNIWP